MPIEKSHRRSVSVEQRPGHFQDLSKFARCHTQESMLLGGGDATSPQHAGLVPGHIIHIRDVHDIDDRLRSESRLHNRVMLVIRTNYSSGAPSLTCLTFCQHEKKTFISPHFVARHACVKCAHTGHGTEAANNDISQLRVVVERKDWMSAPPPVVWTFTPEPDVWLNIREIWNVDVELAVAVLGEAEPDSFRTILEQVVDVFSSTVLGVAGRRGSGRRDESEPQVPATRTSSVVITPPEEGGDQVFEFGGQRNIKTYHKKTRREKHWLTGDKEKEVMVEKDEKRPNRRDRKD